MIQVKFSCKACGLDKAIAEVPARESPNVNVKWYVEHVIANAVLKVHARLSPLCTERRVDLMIPVCDEGDPNPWIGKQTKHDSSAT